MKKIITTGLILTSAVLNVHAQDFKKSYNDKNIIVYQEAYSEAINDEYKYVAFKVKGKNEIKIEGSQTAGTKINENSCKTKLKYDKYKSEKLKNKKPYFIIGFDGLSAKNTKDKRVIEHRLYCQKGKNYKVEMVLKTADENLKDSFLWADAMSGNIKKKINNTNEAKKVKNISAVTTQNIAKNSTNAIKTQEMCDDMATKFNKAYYSGNFDFIRKYAKKVSQVCPNDYNNHILIGTAYFHQLNNLVFAKQYFKKAIKINPNYTRAYLNLSSVEIEQENFDEAVKLLDSQLKLNLDDEDRFRFNFNAGLALFKKGAAKESVRTSKSLAKAKKYFLDALQYNTNSAQAYYYLGHIYESRFNDRINAKKYFDIGCKLGNPDACGR